MIVTATVHPSKRNLPLEVKLKKGKYVKGHPYHNLFYVFRFVAATVHGKMLPV
jgi:hypothetical protein